ncbi:MAG TPA: glycosyltransferase [Candidatus Synoicihabitans sp.]|nr:glycosyltransferase [Candidatus Synoicihabitans sp.]
MNFLRVIASLDPERGGPSAGIRALTPVLAAQGHTTTCVSLDAPGLLPTDAAPGATVHSLGPARGGYCYASRLLPWLREHAARYDAVFVHGLWQYHGYTVHRTLRRTRTPYVVFPHGMLDPWFQQAYPLKHFKKTIYWRLIEHRVLRDAAAVLFTSEEERRLAPTSFRPYHATERVVVYGTTKSHFSDSTLAEAFQATLPGMSSPYWLYLGRLHEKKGIDLLVEAYAKLAATAAAALPALVIAGPPQDAAFVERLRHRVGTLAAGAEVHWTGMLQGAAKWSLLSRAEALILPSHQENFGIVVAEALACGTPVLISNKVNIWREIEADGAGLVEADTLAGTSQLLDRWLALAPRARARMRVAAHRCFEQRFEISRVAASLVATIRGIRGET